MYPTSATEPTLTGCPPKPDASRPVMSDKPGDW